MGFLDKLLGKKAVEPIQIYAPLNGAILERQEIPDPTFSDEVLGPTLCFKPEGDDQTIYAPCDGVISQIFKTAHAVTITSKDKVEILIHVGINTVDLKGQGFEAYVHDDQEVKAGQPLIRFDSKVIADAGLCGYVPFVILNASDYATCQFVTPQPITTKDVVCTLTAKEE